MTQYLELEAADRALYDATLRASHRIRVNVNVYDRNEELIGPLAGNVVSGQVDADLGSSITRSLGLTLVDPTDGFLFDPMGPVYADKFIEVLYGVYVPDLAEWVDVPVFFGPVSYYSRNNHEISLEGVGKEALLLPPVKQVLADVTPPTNRYLRTILLNLIEPFGEEKLRLSEGRGHKLSTADAAPDPAKGKLNGVWWYMQELAAARGLRLMYAADGYLELRQMNPEGAPSFAFEDALNQPTASYDLTQTRNMVQVWDQDAKAENKERARVDLPAAHPLSKESLGRNGKDRTLFERIEINVAKMSQGDATKVARRALDRYSQGLLSVQFEHLPVPHLELGDKVEIDARGTKLTFNLEQFTLPLVPGDSMSIGYTRALKLKTLRRIT